MSFVKNRMQRRSLIASVVAHGLLLAVLLGLLPHLLPTADQPIEPLAISVIPVQPAEPSGPPPAPVTPSTNAITAPASLEAPPSPSAEDWKLASTYTLKNSKRYRNTWGQQVRSMMGTAFEGPDQGAVRFLIEIAPNGQLSKLQTIWSTSDKAEKLARQAIANLPPLPPTPTGQPLVFEKTISFQPFEDGWPPIYKFDCLPDPPRYGNPFAWNGSGAMRPPPPPSQKSDQPLPTECPDLPPDSLEAEAADMKRQFDLWESSRLKTHPQ